MLRASQRDAAQPTAVFELVSMSTTRQGTWVLTVVSRQCTTRGQKSRPEVPPSKCKHLVHSSGISVRRAVLKSSNELLLRFYRAPCCSANARSQDRRCKPNATLARPQVDLREQLQNCAGARPTAEGKTFRRKAARVPAEWRRRANSVGIEHGFRRKESFIPTESFN